MCKKSIFFKINISKTIDGEKIKFAELKDLNLRYILPGFYIFNSNGSVIKFIVVHVLKKNTQIIQRKKTYERLTYTQEEQQVGVPQGVDTDKQW